MIEISTRKKCGKSTKAKSNQIECTVMRRHNKRIVNGITDELEGYAKSVAVLIDAGDYDKLVRPYKKDAIKLEFENVEFKQFRTRDCTELPGIPSGFVLTLIETNAKAADFLKRPAQPLLETNNDIRDNSTDPYTTIELAA